MRRPRHAGDGDRGVVRRARRGGGSVVQGTCLSRRWCTVVQRVDVSIVTHAVAPVTVRQAKEVVDVVVTR
ncbi:hypothetical protein GCM10009562_01260 [Nocardioides aquaticus]